MKKNTLIALFTTAVLCIAIIGYGASNNPNYRTLVGAGSIPYQHVRTSTFTASTTTATTITLQSNIQAVEIYSDYDLYVDWWGTDIVSTNSLVLKGGQIHLIENRDFGGVSTTKYISFLMKNPNTVPTVTYSGTLVTTGLTTDTATDGTTTGTLSLSATGTAATSGQVVMIELRKWPAPPVPSP